MLIGFSPLVTSAGDSGWPVELLRVVADWQCLKSSPVEVTEISLSVTVLPSSGENSGLFFITFEFIVLFSDESIIAIILLVKRVNILI